jgi:hypothetical protein
LGVLVTGYARLSGRVDSTFRVTGTWTEDDGSTAIDLTGCSIVWRIKGAGDLHEFEDDAHASITSEEDGEFLLYLSDEEMSDLRDEGAAVLKFDVRILFPDGTKTVIVFGDLVIDDGVFS